LLLDIFLMKHIHVFLNDILFRIFLLSSDSVF